MVENEGPSSPDVAQGTASQSDSATKEEKQEMQPNRAGHRHTAAETIQGVMVSQVLHLQDMKFANLGSVGLLLLAIITFVLGLYECGAGCA